MARRPNVWAALVLLGGCNLLFALPSEPGAEGAGAENPTQPEVKQPPTPPKKIDPIHLPADAVIIVSDQAADLLKQLPKYIVVTPEKYQEFLDQKAQLRALLDAQEHRSRRVVASSRADSTAT